MRQTSEFDHYPGCRMRDPDNCSGCALITGGKDGPNYTAWTLAYLENGRTIPAKWRDAFKRELGRTDNAAYVKHLKATMAKGIRFSDWNGLLKEIEG